MPVTPTFRLRPNCIPVALELEEPETQFLGSGVIGFAPYDHQIPSADLDSECRGGGGIDLHADIAGKSECLRLADETEVIAETRAEFDGERAIRLRDDPRARLRASSAEWICRGSFQLLTVVEQHGVGAGGSGKAMEHGAYPAGRAGSAEREAADGADRVRPADASARVVAGAQQRVPGFGAAPMVRSRPGDSSSPSAAIASLAIVEDSGAGGHAARRSRSPDVTPPPWKATGLPPDAVRLICARSRMPFGPGGERLIRHDGRDYVARPSRLRARDWQRCPGPRMAGSKGKVFCNCAGAGPLMEVLLKSRAYPFQEQERRYSGGPFG